MDAVPGLTELDHVGSSDADLDQEPLELSRRRNSVRRSQPRYQQGCSTELLIGASPGVFPTVPPVSIKPSPRPDVDALGANCDCSGDTEFLVKKWAEGSTYALALVAAMDLRVETDDHPRIQSVEPYVLAGYPGAGLRIDVVHSHPVLVLDDLVVEQQPWNRRRTSTVDGDCELLKGEGWLRPGHAAPY